MRVERIWKIALCAVVILSTGCFGYSFSGRTRAGDVYMPFFEDRSSGERALDVGNDLTQRLVGEFRQDSHTHVFQTASDRGRAQKELLGVVKRVTESILSRDPNETGEEYRVVVECSVTYRDLATDKVLWQSANVTGDGQYLLSQGDTGFRGALDEALGEVVRSIIDNTLRAW